VAVEQSAVAGLIADIHLEEGDERMPNGKSRINVRMTNFRSAACWGSCFVIRA
jgi:hypothetical protein